MTMDDVKASNAIVALVSAYADALAGAKEREAQQAALVALLSKDLEPLRRVAAQKKAAEPIVSAAVRLCRAKPAKDYHDQMEHLRAVVKVFLATGGCCSHEDPSD
jgi:hypothetical protein